MQKPSKYITTGVQGLIFGFGLPFVVHPVQELIQLTTKPEHYLFPKDIGVACDLEFNFNAPQDDLSSCNLQKHLDTLVGPVSEIAGIDFSSITLHTHQELVIDQATIARNDIDSIEDIFPGFSPYDPEIEQKILDAVVKTNEGLHMAVLPKNHDFRMYGKCIPGLVEPGYQYAILHEIAHLITYEIGIDTGTESKNKEIFVEGLAEYMTNEWLIPELHKQGAISENLVSFSDTVKEMHRQNHTTYFNGQVGIGSGLPFQELETYSNGYLLFASIEQDLGSVESVLIDAQRSSQHDIVDELVTTFYTRTIEAYKEKHQ